MKIAIATAAALLAASSFAFAADNNGSKGGKDGPNTDPATTGSLKGNGLNIDGSSDDAAKCREGSAGAALCQQDGMKEMQQ